MTTSGDPAVAAPAAKHDETEFQAFLDAIMELAFVAEGLIVGGKKGTVSAGEFEYPAKAVWDLKIPTTLHFIAGMGLVRDPKVAQAADLMVRAMLETMSHIAWIWLGEPASNRNPAKADMCLGDDSVAGCTPERRAVCLALGMTQVFSDNINKVDPALVPASTSPAIGQRLAKLKDLHNKLGCSGKGRTWSDVRPMLALLKSRGHIPWAHDLWVAESGVAHGLIPDQYWSDVTGTVMKGGPAQPENRYLLATWLTKTYFNVAYCCLGILRPGDKQKLKQALATALQGQPFDWVDGT